MVKATLASQEIKETTIGNEIFGKDYDPIKNDTKVRVYVYNLRKKLDQYYESESPNTEFKFSIEKGQYKVNFRSSEPNTKSKWNKNLIIIGSLLIIFAITLIVITNPFTNNHTPFWKDYFNNQRSTRLIIGDHFLISGEVPTRSKGMFRDSRINSIHDFNRFIKSHPEKASQLSPTTIAYITKMGVVCSAAFSKVFHRKQSTS